MTDDAEPAADQAPESEEPAEKSSENAPAPETDAGVSEESTELGADESPEGVRS